MCNYVGTKENNYDSCYNFYLDQPIIKDPHNWFQEYGWFGWFCSDISFEPYIFVFRRLSAWLYPKNPSVAWQIWKTWD